MITTALVLATLLVPFAIYSQHVTGSIGGIVTIAGKVSGRAFFGQGLHSYLRDNPFRLYGVVIAPIMVVGLASIVWPPPGRRRAARLLAIVAVLQVIALGLASHASTRFVFLSMVLLTVLGVDRIERWLRGRRVRAAAAWALVVACVAMTAAVAPLERKIAGGLASMVTAARAIRADAAGRPCTVIARATPQLMWYSGCASHKIHAAAAPVALDRGRRWYAASTPRRPIDPGALAAACRARVVALGVPGAWRLVRY